MMAVTVSYQYAPLPSSHHIRVLKISQGTSTEVAASLEVISLDDDPVYDCLSYVWNGPHSCDVGDEWTTACKTMLLDGVSMPIRQNLQDALTSLRKRGYTDCPIWIDAVCINQANIPERNAQVALMSRLYSECRDVIVWLGYENAQTAVALRAMSRLTFSMERVSGVTGESSNELEPDLEPVNQDFAACKFSDEELCAIVRLFATNVWFSRVWTLQEMILARHMQFQLGQQTASLEVIWRGSGIASIFPGLCSAWQEVKERSELRRPYMFWHDIWGKYMRTVTRDQLSYIGIVAHQHRGREATDARDKVFGLLGLSGISCSSLKYPFPVLLEVCVLTMKQ